MQKILLRTITFILSSIFLCYVKSSSRRREKLHISKDCFVPFGVSFVFPRKAIYADKFNEYILRIQQTGLMGKLLNEFKWEVERSSTGKLLQVHSFFHYLFDPPQETTDLKKIISKLCQILNHYLLKVLLVWHIYFRR